MQIQIVTFHGPRGPEALAASRRAGEERIAPLIAAHPTLREALLGGVRAVGPDGAEVVVEFARDASALDELSHLVMTSELLPGEDPALLPGPDRVERYSVADLFGPLADKLGGWS